MVAAVSLAYYLGSGAAAWREHRCQPSTDPSSRSSASSTAAVASRRSSAWRDPRYLRTSALSRVLPDAALERWPELVRHRCECGSAHGIAAELADTELPHLLEHVALELHGARGGAARFARRDAVGLRGGRTRACSASRSRTPTPTAVSRTASLAESALREGARDVNERCCGSCRTGSSARSALFDLLTARCYPSRQPFRRCWRGE